ncbi:hypothetical protein A9X69_13195 [Aeromonas hydrophila]|nr:hypothetical protein A9X69_13195 [Aeromonas hydrophila]
MKGWHIAALMAVLFILKALFVGSTELLFDLFGFHNVILFKDQFWWGGCILGGSSRCSAALDAAIIFKNAWIA